MNEWDLQRVLTKQWAQSGLLINGERQLLVAWEVMLPSWAINDPNHDWTEPSLDFLVVDERMRFTVIELKTRIPGIKPAWLALCQITHRAAELSKTLSEANLDRAHAACWSGKHGRVPPTTPRSFAVHHQRFFEIDKVKSDSSHEVRRCIAAVEFGGSWPEVLSEFNRMSPGRLHRRVCEELTSQSARRELNRFKALCQEDQVVFKDPVIELPLA